MIAVMQGNGSMAKAKKKTVRMGRPPLSPDEARIGRINIRGRMAWYLWIYEFARFLRVDLATLVDQSLAAYAELKGFKKPPER